MATLSKSKLIAHHQCPKRLWLEIHRPELRADSTSTLARFAAGHAVTDVARRIYDPKGSGETIDIAKEGFPAALARSRKLLSSSHPIFEAGFSAAGAMAFADVLLPVHRKGKAAWRMIEVKSSTSVKDYHREDAAIQAFVFRNAGVPLAGISLAHIDTTWVFPGEDKYQGLLKEEDLTEEAFGRDAEVKKWITEAQAVARQKSEPIRATGDHCYDPFECGFLDHCQSQEPKAEYPIAWLPRLQSKAVTQFIGANGVIDVREIPDSLLNGQQQRVKAHTLSGTVYFNAQQATADLAKHKLPAYFLDFETIKFAVPIWKGTRPYQTLPFQFSVHRLSRNGKLEHEEFLDLSGEDPGKALAEALIAACGERGPVFVYSSFESTQIRELTVRFPSLKRPLLALRERLVDLFPIAQNHYYHPSQQGSWSIKNVLPAIDPTLRYDALDGVKDGGMAMEAYIEGIASGTAANRKAQIDRELRDYCALDTQAMIKLWEFFSGGRQPAT